jgi:N-acetylated-alpha-linked acidic dipeptidase
MSKRISFFVFCFFLLSISRATDSNFLGFLSSSRESQLKYESILLSVPTGQNARESLHQLTEEPHVAGTEADRKTAEFVRDRFSEFGLHAELVEYPVYLNYPKKVSLRMTRPKEEELSLREEGIPEDKDSYSDSAFPGFHGYGASGNAKGQIVYVNYGTPDDFDTLEGLGISVRGKIVLVRYGENFRGLKVREAQMRGAAGVIIYSDPADDGYMRGDVYPHGPMRPKSGIQRGSVRFNSEGSGDPTTPGWASVKGAKRVEATEGMPKIPSLPLSYGEAEKLLKALGGPNAPQGWQGGLPFAYHVGPGGTEIEMSVEMDYAIRPIWNVIATIPGGAEKDRWVILGNHRDAWTYGAVDPNSGTATLIETARAFGEAYKQGWRPRRTIVLASWDGEEYALLGSTEWAEDKAVELNQKAVAYLNCDVAVTGPDFSANGVGSLRDLVLEVAGRIPDPKKGKSILQFWSEKTKRSWATSEPVDLDQPDREFYLNLTQLGSGSDYTAFLDHLGIASVDFSFDGNYGVYHSIYDNFFWMEKFGDPEFIYHATAAKFYALLAARLAAADIVPMRYVPYALRFQEDFDQLRRSHVVELRNSPTGPSSTEKQKPVLKVDFSSIKQSLSSFAEDSKQLDAALDALQSSSNVDPASLEKLNDTLVRVEREFLDPAGLPKRPWFKHMLIAPGYNAGYAPWPFPGIQQALVDRDAAMFDAESKKIVARLDAARSRMREATALAQQLKR